MIKQLEKNFKIIVSMKLVLAIVIAIGMSACATPQASNSCFPRTGACIQATVNGESLTPIESGDFLEAYKKVSPYVDQVTAYITKPISGELDIQLALTEFAAPWFGTPLRQTIQVVALEQVQLESSARPSTSPNVRVNGTASLGVKNVLDSNILPSGKYLLRLAINGSDNWDRKTIFLEVKQPN